MNASTQPAHAVWLTIFCWLAAPVTAHAQTRLMVVGDSISQGSAGDYTWRFQLGRHLERAGANVDFVGDRTWLFDATASNERSMAYADWSVDADHHALWGRPVNAEKQTIRAAVAAHQPDVITVLLGTNDFAWLGRTPAQVASDMETLVHEARRGRNDVDIVIGHMLTKADLWGGSRQLVAESQDYNARLDSLARRLDVWGARVVTAKTEEGWDPFAHTWDGTHPNSTGEVRIAAKMADALARIGVGEPYGSVPLRVQWPAEGWRPELTPGNGKMTLRWPSVPGANAYYVQRDALHASGGFEPLPFAVTGNSWTDQGLVPGEIYAYRMVPLKGTMVGLPGQAAQAMAGGVRPGQATGLTVTPSSDGRSATLRWSAVPNASGYYIEQQEWLTKQTDQLPWPVSSTSFTVGGLHPGLQYYFRVLPINGRIEGTWSDKVAVHQPSAPLDQVSIDSNFGFHASTDACPGVEGFFVYLDGDSADQAVSGTVYTYNPTGGECVVATRARYLDYQNGAWWSAFDYQPNKDWSLSTFIGTRCWTEHWIRRRDGTYLIVRLFHNDGPAPACHVGL